MLTLSLIVAMIACVRRAIRNANEHAAPKLYVLPPDIQASIESTEWSEEPIAGYIGPQGRVRANVHEWQALQQ